MVIENVLALLKDVIGHRVEVPEGLLLKEMEDYWVWEVRTRRPDLHLIVKLAGPRAAYTSAFERTAALHRLVRERTSICLPEVIAADESCQKWPWRYFIKTFLPGTEWAVVARGIPAGELDRSRFQLGEAAASLHQINFNGFGELDNQAGVPKPLPYPEALAKRVQQMITSPQAQDYLLSLLASKDALLQDIRTPALCHEDLHHYNLLLGQENGEYRLAGILDFEKAWAGERETDLARMDLWGMTGEPFWRAYQERCPVDRGYAERKLIYQLIWCVEYAEDSSQQKEITRKLCRFLDLPVIESFEPFKVTE